MIKVTAKVEGLSELQQFLRTLPDAITKKMLYSSLMGAAKPIMLQAQDNVLQIFGGSSRYTGTLEAGIVRGRARSGYAARVDVRLKKPKARTKTVIHGVSKPHGDDPYYGRWLEFGRAQSKHSGAMPARPWLKPAAMAKQDEAGEEFRKALTDQMVRWCRENGVEYSPSGLRK